MTAVLAAAVAGAVTGCATGGAASDGKPGGTVNSDPPRILLEGRSFLSTEVSGYALVPGTRIRLSFDSGQIAADAGCNGMGGDYAWDGHRLRVSSVSMTEIGCDPDRHAQDDWLVGLLSGGPSLVLDGQTLLLSDGASEVTMIDREIVEPDLPLAATRWRVDTIIDGDSVSSIPLDAEAFLVFEQAPAGAATRVTGDTGCNQLGGEVVITSDAMTFREVVTTKMACSGGRDVLERAVVPLFDGRPIAYTIEADRLSLIAPDGHGVWLRAS